MQEKATNEFDGVEGHRPLPVATVVILPPKRHLAILTGEEPPIGDGHAMRVARQVAEDALRPGQRRLGIDHPLRLLHGVQELVPGRGRPSAGTAPAYGGAPGRRPAAARSGRAAKQAAEDPYREEEPLGARAPRRCHPRPAPRRDQAMDMGMMVQGLAPGMQDAEKADLRA